MSGSTSRRGLWLPVLALLISVGAAWLVFAADWGEPPPPPFEEEERLAERPRPATGPLDGPPIEDRTDVSTDGEETSEEAASEVVVVAAPEGVVAPEGEGIVGILVDSSGNSIARARIKVARSLEDMAKSGGSELAGAFRLSAGGIGFGREAGVTDRQGRFAVRTPGKDGKYDVTFNHPDHAAHTVSGVVWTRGSRVDLGVVRVPAGGVIFGFVRDETGKPLAGARVNRTASGGSGGTRRTLSNVVSIAMSGQDGQVISFGGSSGELTDAEGYFEMTRVPPGTYTLKAAVKGKADAVREGVIVGEGGRSGPIGLVPSAGLEVSGMVVDEHGQPVSGAMVMAHVGGGQRNTRTDDQGAFTLTALPPGKVRLTVFGGGRGRMWGGGGASISETVEAGTSGVRLVLTAGLVLAGRLVDSVTGSPVNGARVTLVSRNGESERRRITIGMNGAFRFPNQKPGTHSIEVTAPGYRKATEGPFTLVEGRSIEDILIRMEPQPR